ncbi:MAG TPA: alkaline phosphatase family protein, partial [Thermoanaerobaculia bacterium]|nr:alkaline phosphatase family protein [Thermoanaerobaculia bacterium]
PRVIFIGLDGADWQLLDRLAQDGTMPNLAALVRDGSRGPLLTQHPPLSPLVWTTMMTGVSPLRHRILDFTRYNPVTRQREPITSDERAVPAIWNMVSSAGRRVDVVGLWATYPPEKVNGTIVSDREIVQQGGGSGVERIRIETELRHRLGVQLIERDHPDLAIVYFDGTDAMGHLLAPNVPRDYFARIDAILGDYRKLAEKTKATLVVASDHGFDWSKPSGKQPADNHRDEGIVLRYPRGPLPRSVAEICPTLLELLGMPRDVDDYRRSYHRPGRTLSAPTGRGAQRAPGEISANEQIAKLKALGYIGGDEPASSGTSTRTAGSWSNEGLILREQGRADDAIAAFENALRVDPNHAATKWNLSRSLLLRGKDALKRNDCKAALEDFARAAELAPNDALAFASRGTAQLCLGDERAARASFRRSLDIDPNQPLR